MVMGSHEALLLDGRRPGSYGRGVTVLISPDDLDRRISAGQRIVLLDVRWQLGSTSGRAEYLEGHLPGAVYVDLESELAAPPSATSGRHPLPDVASLQRAARRWGARTDDLVVAYDASGGLSAARAWWLLRWGGHREVLLLDGGLAAWQAAGGRLVPGEVSPEMGDITLSAGHLPVVGISDLRDPAGVVLDARAPERYRGEVEPIDPKAGHLPGALNLPTGDNLDAEGRFLSAPALADRFAAHGVVSGSQVTVY